MENVRFTDAKVWKFEIWRTGSPLWRGWRGEGVCAFRG